MSEVVEFWQLQEDRFYERLHHEIEAGTLHMVDDRHAVCPTCRGIMYFVERGERKTFGGDEPACFQYHCNVCGFGGETVKDRLNLWWDK